jgi:hypothetical protein
VKDSLIQTNNHTMEMADPIAKWRDRLTGVGPGGKLSGPSAPGGPDALQRVTTYGEKLFGGTPLEAAKSALSFLTQPVRTVTHDYQAAKMDRLQDEFLAANKSTIADLNDSMGTIENRTLRLTYLADDAAKTAGKSVLANQLVEKKATLGNELADQIDDALNGASPEDAEKLNALKNDLNSWMKDRDTRVEPERKETKELAQRSEALKKNLYLQRDALDQVSATSHDIRNGAHTRPQTVAYAAAVRNLLVAGRSGIAQTLTK